MQCHLKSGTSGGYRTTRCTTDCKYTYVNNALNISDCRSQSYNVSSTLHKRYSTHIICSIRGKRAPYIRNYKNPFPNFISRLMPANFSSSPIQHFRQCGNPVVVHLEYTERVQIVEAGRDEGEQVAVHVQVSQAAPPPHALG